MLNITSGSKYRYIVAPILVCYLEAKANNLSFLCLIFTVSIIMNKSESATEITVVRNTPLVSVTYHIQHTCICV